MSTTVYMRIVPGGAMCVNHAEASKLDDLVGQEVKAVITKPRNIRFHKLYFALLKTAHDMARTEMNFEQFRAYCQAGSGHCDWVEHRDGLVAVPRSISWGKMDETEFKRLYNDVLGFICETWVLDQEQLNRIVEFI
jgi:hypothetical protein